MSDAELVRQVLDGNTEAYAELVRRHAGRALAVCRARVWHRDDAEELAQEAVFRGLRDLATLRNPELFGHWLCRIARNVCLNWRKDPDRDHRPLTDLEGIKGREEHSGVAAVERDDEVSHLMKKVEALPEDYREALMLYYSQDLTYADLAEVLEVSVATVNYRLWQAREMLRDCFRPA
jgi:RNA polymerase sigma-70 factor (ECF subfamily)